MDESAAVGRWIGGWGLFSWALIALAAAVLPDSPALLHRAPWEVWPLTPAVGVPLVLAVAVYVRGTRRAAPAPSAGRQAAFLGAMAALALALQSPIGSMAPRSFALDAVAELLLRTVAPALLAIAQPGPVLAAGLSLSRRRAVPAPLRALAAVLGHPVPATALFVGVGYLWAWPGARDAALLSPSVRAAMDISMLLSGIIFFRALFDLRPEPAGPTIGTRLLMIWGAELGNILLGYYLTYSSRPLYPAYAAHGLLWGVSPLTNQMFGGQTLWLCDTAMIGAAAMAVIYRWARDEDRLRGPRVRPGDSRATYLARQRASNRRVVLGLLGIVGMIGGVMGMSVILYEVTYHRAVAQAPAVSVNQIP
jgi:putative membrane protein